MGDHSGANRRFAAPQDDGMPTTDNYFDESVISAALERWVCRFGEDACAVVPAQRSENRRAG